jgi:DNA polymerase III epsilon subunit-like protein
MRHEPGYIIIDTEGTGLFRHRDEAGNVVPSDAPGQPRMAEFAAVLADADFNIVDSFRSYVRPVAWRNADGSPMAAMPEGAFNVHGLSMELLNDVGLPAAEVLEIYIDAIRDGRAVVGWNQQHDGRQVRAELRHAGFDDMFEQTKTTCLMRSCSTHGVKIKKLNGKGGFAGLIDAAAHFGVPYDTGRRHTALEDAMVTAGVGLHMNYAGVINEPTVHYAKDYKGNKGDEA